MYSCLPRKICTALLITDAVLRASGGVYTWTGASGDSHWGIAANWTYDGGAVSRAPAIFGGDTVAFTNDAVVIVGSTNVYDGANLALGGHTVEFVYTATGNMYIRNVNAPVTLRSSRYAVLNRSYSLSSALTLRGAWQTDYNGELFTGAGSLTLDGCALTNQSSSATVQFSVPVAVREDTVNRLAMSGHFQFNDAVTGGGTLETYARSSGSGPVFRGDMSDFHGTCHVAAGVDSGLTGFRGVATNMTDSAWHIDRAGSGGFPFGADTPVHFFGALDLSITDGSGCKPDRETTLVIGHLDRDCGLTGAFNTAKATHVIWEAPTATLTLTARGLASLEVTGGGEVDFANVTAGVPKTLTFSGEGGYIHYATNSLSGIYPAIRNATGPIGFDVPEGRTRPLDPAQLDASNVKVFMKKGKGTLLVADGTVFASLPDEQLSCVTINGLDPETQCVRFTRDPDTGYVTVHAVAIAATEVTVSDPTQQNVQDAVDRVATEQAETTNTVAVRITEAPASAITVNLRPGVTLDMSAFTDSAAALVTVNPVLELNGGMIDARDAAGDCYYTAASLRPDGAGRVRPVLDATVARPVLAPDDAAPMALDDGGISFTVVPKTGLYYGLAVVAGPAATEMTPVAGSFRQATDTESLTITAPLTMDGTVIYYRLISTDRLGWGLSGTLR